MAKGHQSGRRTTLTGSTGIGQIVRVHLVEDPDWAHVARNGAWICPYCLSAVRGADTAKAALARAVENHLDRRCTGWQNGKGTVKPAAEIITRQAYEEIAHLAATDTAWQVFDHEGFWYSPCSLQKVHTVRLAAGRFDSFTVRNMVQHLLDCEHYRAGVIRTAPEVQHARDAHIRAAHLISNVRQLLEYPLWRYADAHHHWVCPFCLDAVQNITLLSPVDWELAPDRMAWHLAGECSTYVPEHPQTRDEASVRTKAGGGEPHQRPTSQSGAGTRSGGLRIARSGSYSTGAQIRTPRQALLTNRTPLPNHTPSQEQDGSSRPRVATPIHGNRTPVTGIAPGGGRIATPLPGALRSPAPADAPDFAAPTAAANPLSGTIFDSFVADAVSPTAPSGSAVAEADGHFSWMDAVEAETKIITTSPDSDRAKARDVQVGLLGKIPELPGYRFAARFEACDDVSGDFYEFISLPDGRLGFAQGDVSGHGMQAGLIMSMAKKTLSIYAASGLSPAPILTQVNDSLVDDLGGRIFISMTYAILDPGLGQITWARAGHNPTLRYNVHTGDIEEIRPKGMVVGMKKGAIFQNALEEAVTQVRAGDVFLIYTDGINETMNRQNEEFGLELLIEVVRKHSAAGPDILLDRIMDSVRQFRGGSTASDDSTLLALCVD